MGIFQSSLLLRTEMPVRYWKNLPEASLIPDLLAEARHRTETMIDTAPTPPRKVRVQETAPSASDSEANTLAALKLVNGAAPTLTSGRRSSNHNQS